MKLVTYNKNSYYSLTDEQFTSAMGMWSKGQSAYVETVGALLPPPKGPAGVIPEHLGLEIFYCHQPSGFPGSPGWVALSPGLVENGKEVVRSALYYRAKELGAEELSYSWQEVNVLRPSVIGGLGVDHGTTDDDVTKFVAGLELTPIDEVLSSALRNHVSLDPLLPSYYLN